MKSEVFLLIFFFYAPVIAQDTLKHQDFVPTGRVLVQVFGYSKLDATENTKQSVSFGSTRAQFGYEQLFSPTLSARVILDAAGRTTTVGDITVKDTAGRRLQVTNNSVEGSYYTAFLKFAYIQWQPSDRATLQVGGILQNHYITQEKFWGYRYVYETFQDRYYGTASGDWGAIGYLKVNETIGLDAAVTNGDGIRSKQDAYGKVKYAAGIDVKPVQGLITRFYYDNLASGDSLRTATQHLFSFFAGYKLENVFRIGIDANFRKNNQNYASHDAYGYSLFATYVITPEIECFVRFDKVLSNTLSRATTSWNHANYGQAYIAGIQYQPVKTIRFALDYQGWKPEDTSSSIKNFMMVNTEFSI
jgi:hypothetical protein